MSSSTVKLKARKRGRWSVERDAPLAVREMLMEMERHLDAIAREGRVARRRGALLDADRGHLRGDEEVTAAGTRGGGDDRT